MDESYSKINGLIDCRDSPNCSAICNKAFEHAGRWTYDCDTQTGNLKNRKVSISWHPGFRTYQGTHRAGGSWYVVVDYTAQEWIDGELWNELFDEEYIDAVF